MWASGAYGYLSDYLWWWIAVVSLGVHTWCFFRLFPLRRYRRTGLVLGNLLVLCTMLGIAGLAGETYVRFLIVETDSFGASLVSKRWFQIYPQLNSLYCRDEEWTEQKPPGVRRIAFVGDSFTYGWGINDATDRFTNLIQTRFDDDSPHTTEIMNVAWAGWDTRAELAAVHDMILEYAVDEFVLCVVPNDIEPLLPVPSYGDPKKPPQSRYIHTESSFLLDYLFHRVVAPRMHRGDTYWDWLADGYADPAIWGQSTRMWDEIVSQCTDADVLLRVVLLPLIRTDGRRYDAARIHAQIADYFARRGIEVLDLRETTQDRAPGDLVVNPHDSHPNELAHRLFADAIWEAFYEARQPRE